MHLLLVFIHICVFVSVSNHGYTTMAYIQWITVQYLSTGIHTAVITTTSCAGQKRIKNTRKTTACKTYNSSRCCETKQNTTTVCTALFLASQRPRLVGQTVRWVRACLRFSVHWSDTTLGLVKALANGENMS